MKKTTKIFLSLLGVITLIVTVFASVTVAKERKSAKLPWTGTLSGSYDSAHNVGTSYLPESRFSTGGSIPTGVVYDSVTTLYWQATANTSEQTTCKTYDTNTFTDTNCNDGIVGDDCNWCGAKSYCDALSLGGYSDWRLPNKNELLSIIDTSRYNPGINTTYFNSASSNYWSSTTYAAGTNNAWFVYFYYGSADNTTRTYSNYVRCVR